MGPVLEDILQLLRTVTGLDSATVGGDLVERGVRRRMEALALSDENEYQVLVRRSRNELQRLINEVTVPETWFYRDYQPFVLLEQFVENWHSKHPTNAVLRVLSIPCSSGEEAYSIAMTLLRCGLRTEQFCVEAFDINTLVLDRARKGVYGRNSFRGERLEFREQFFRETPSGYEVIPSLRSAVTFSHGNILDRGFMSGHEPYDVIFCRNLLIYFGAAHKKQALNSLNRLLQPTGLLFLGHAETGLFVEESFESVRLSGTFAYRKHSSAGNRMPARKRPQKSVVDVKPAAKTQADVVTLEEAASKKLAFQTPIAPAAAISVAQNKEPHALNYKEDISAIELLADKGELDRALVQCQAFIDNFPTAAEAYYLMGVINLAQCDESAAVNFFRKALYLNSDYYQALVQLSVLADKDGNARAARNYRMRAQRLRSEGGGA